MNTETAGHLNLRARRGDWWHNRRPGVYPVTKTRDDLPT